MRPRLCLITGSGSGLGKALAQQLALQGVPLFLTSKDAEKLSQLAQDLAHQTSVEIFVGDLCKPQDVEALLVKIQEKAPDLVINNAGLGLYGEILSYSLEEQMQIVKLNIDALVQISIEAARALQRQNLKGTIMNISSAAACFTYPSFSLYAASKRFVQEFSLSFDEETRTYGIRVLIPFIKNKV